MHESVHCGPQKSRVFARIASQISECANFFSIRHGFFSLCVPMFVSSFGVMTGAMRDSYIRMCLFVCSVHIKLVLRLERCDVNSVILRFVLFGDRVRCTFSLSMFCALFVGPKNVLNAKPRKLPKKPTTLTYIEMLSWSCSHWRSAFVFGK